MGSGGVVHKLRPSLMYLANVSNKPRAFALAELPLPGSPSNKEARLAYSYRTGTILSQPNANGQILENASNNSKSTDSDRGTR